MIRPFYFLVFFLVIGTQAVAQDWEETTEPLKENPYKIEQFSFLTGSWKGTLGPYTIQEVWSSANDRELMGMFRMYNAESVRLYEFMSLSLSLDGVILRIKHFDQQFVGAEEKEESALFDLEEVGERKAVFKQMGTATYLIFERRSDTALRITLRKTSSVKTTDTVFDFMLER